MSIPNKQNPLGNSKSSFYIPLTLTAAEPNSTVQLTAINEPITSRIAI